MFPGEASRSEGQILERAGLQSPDMDTARLLKNERSKRRYLEAYDRVLRAWPEPYESRMIETSFGDTHVLSSGCEDGPPLVLLHGAGVSATMWRPNVARFGARRRVHAVDVLWDMGKSAPTAFPQSHGEAVRWFSDVLDGLGHDEVDLVGLSYGGFLAFRFALDVPERIRRLAVLSPAASLTDLSGKFILNALSMIIVPTRPAVICRAMTRWTSESPIDDDLLDQWVTGLRGVRFPTPMHKVPPLVLVDDELRRLEPETLLLMGEKEWTCKKPREAMERFRRLVPRGEAELFEGAGHMLSMDFPDKTCERVLEHLDRDHSQGGSASAT